MKENKNKKGDVYIMWCANYEIRIPMENFMREFPIIRESKICKYNDLDSCEEEMQDYLYDRCEDYIDAIRKMLLIFGVDEGHIEWLIEEWYREIFQSIEFEEVDPKEYYES